MVTKDVLYTKRFFILGKSSSKHKAKNTKKTTGSQEGATDKDNGKKPFKIPRNSTPPGADSEDEDLGRNDIISSSYKCKFSGEASSSVSRMLNSANLLSDPLSSLSKDFEKLILYSASKQTWARHASAWKLYKNFCDEFAISFSIPIPVCNIRGFVTWAVTKKNLKSSTVVSYISSLNVAHTLNGCTGNNLNSDTCVKMALKGAENISAIFDMPKKTRIPMNIYLLEILNDRIAKLEWSDLSKQIFWTACTVCFFSTCRMGELLPENEKYFDPSTTLLWENVKQISDKDVIIFIPYSKTTGFKGKMVDLFAIKGNKCCPVSAIRRLNCMVWSKNSYEPKKPVFTFKSGRFLTKGKMNLWLSELLSDFVDENHTITGHSFRAAIPSLLNFCADENSIEEIKAWGSWKTDSCKLYTRQERESRRAIFTKIVNCLYNI